MHFHPSTIPDEAEAGLAPAFARSDTDEPGMWVERCRQDMAQLWRAGECWAVTEVRNTKTCLAAHIVAIAGSEPDVLVNEIEAWARRNGCRKIYYSGRMGWLRRRRDYKLRCVTAEKEL